MAAATHFSPDLAAHRGLQRIAYGVLERVDAGLRDGMTERDVATRIERHLAERGIVDLRPGPFVWFGDRSAGRGLGTQRACAPSLRALETGMPLILGVAFRFRQYSCHAAYSTCFGENPALERARSDLVRVRARALEAAAGGATSEAIELDVNALVTALGYEAVHGRLPGFPLVESVDRALWRVGPHIARGDVGAAFRELLVVAPGRARWLCDDLPHTSGAFAFRDLAGTTHPSGPHIPWKENDREA
jgi:hypothetical protein